MRTIACVCLLISTISSAVYGQLQSIEDDESARVLALENAWNQAEARGDSHALELLLEAQFSDTSPAHQTAL
jgi:hypothetical protein